MPIDRTKAAAISRVLWLALAAVSTLVLMGGMTFVSSSEPEVSPFQVLSDLIIPSIVGFASLLVTWAAWRTSKEATNLSRDVEFQRRAAEEARQKETTETRIRDMAVADAKVLRRWVVESDRHLASVSSDGSQPELSREQAKLDAQVALEGSIVPGALRLFILTRYDLENRLEWLDWGDTTNPLKRAKSHVLWTKRVKRTSDRITRWALEPTVTAELLESEWLSIRRDSWGYLNFGAPHVTDE